jgi:hypothetical protein
MKVYAETNKVLFTKGTAHGWDVVTVRSKSNPNVTYTVDMTHGRCSCPAWKFQKGGERKPCKHLRALGFKQVMHDTDFVAEPVVNKVKTTVKEKS